MSNPLADAIDELITVTDWLKASLLPATHAPYRPELSVDRRDELAHERRLEAAQDEHAEAKTRGQYALPTTSPLGESPVPFRVEILDLLFEITEFASTHCELPRRRKDEDDPTVYLEEISKLLTQGRLGADLSVVEDRCEDLIHRSMQALGLVEDGQLLHAECPWCKGRTARHPEGGQRTMRIRAQLPPGKRSAVTVHPSDVTWLVVCESGLCEPTAADCGMSFRGRPAWRLSSEGDWLSDRIERAKMAS